MYPFVSPIKEAGVHVPRVPRSSDLYGSLQPFLQPFPVLLQCEQKS